MERIADNIIGFLECEKNRTSVELCKIKLGIEVVIHNVVMISFILLISKLIGIFVNSAFLLTAYGLLKLTAGGIHLKKSSHCIFCTLLFVFCGVAISNRIQVSILWVMFFYSICIMGLYFMAPQGTENNPISYPNSIKLKWKSIILVSMYLGITIYKYINAEKLPYLLLIATVFETCSLVPYFIKSYNKNKKTLIGD